MIYSVPSLAFDPVKGHDVVKPIATTFDPNAYVTQEAAATALYEALVKLNRDIGGPDGEVMIKNPEEAEAHGVGKCWWVCWESGPYQWGSGSFIQGPWGFCESYQGFDLCFTT